MPNRMKSLPTDDVGRPVPFFAGYVDGVPDFRTMTSAALVDCVRKSLCWVCGQPLLKRYGKPVGTFVAGPMCLVNGTSAEPPSHADCAEWCARACPFLLNPNKVRREANLPDGYIEPAGIMLARNPGVTGLIESCRWQAFQPGEGRGVLLHFDRIQSVTWLARGDIATTDEVLTSIETGLPDLLALAREQEADGAVHALRSLVKYALLWVDGWRGAVQSDAYPVIAELV